MIIDSKKYNGLCSCGKEHKMTTEACFIESGALFKASNYLEQYGLHGYSVAIYDANTYRATAGLHPKADKEIIMNKIDLVTDNIAILVKDGVAKFSNEIGQRQV